MLSGNRTELTRKSYSNARVYAIIKRRSDELLRFTLGAQAIDDGRPSLRRDYSKLRSRYMMTADDFTFPVYAAVPYKDWYVLTRGQCLLFIDCRSLKILGWSLQPDRNYNSLVIRSAQNRVCREWHMPRVINYERGIWKRSRLVRGAAPIGWQISDPSAAVSEYSWEQAGVRIIHSIRARSKLAELVGGKLQNLMEGVPGYCGRNERRDCPEVVKKNKLAVESRRAEPAGLFLFFDEWKKELEKLVKTYNAATQEGYILDGRSPNVAMLEFWPVDDPPIEWGPQHWHLFAHWVSKRTVGKEGISFTIGGKSYVYRDESTGPLRGQEVLTWFDPEYPNVVGVTDLNSRNPIVVPKREDVDVLAVLDRNSPEYSIYQEELRKADGHERYWRTQYQIIKRDQGLNSRKSIVSPEIAEVGETFAAQRAAHTDTARKREVEARRANRVCGNLGHSVPPGATPDMIRSMEALDEFLRADRKEDQ